MSPSTGRTTIPRRTRWRVWQRDQGVCGLCGQPVDFTEMEVDHVVAWAIGGPDDEANLRTTHGRCNRSRPRPARTRPRGPNERTLVVVRREQNDLERLDDYRFAHRFPSRAAAIKWLLRWALEQNPAPPSTK